MGKSLHCEVIGVLVVDIWQFLENPVPKLPNQVAPFLCKTGSFVLGRFAADLVKNGFRASGPK